MNFSFEDFIPEKTHFDFGNLKFDFFIVSNSKELVEAYNAQSKDKLAQKDKSAPHWSKLWNAGIVLSRYLVNENIIRSGMKVTELGCGLGLAGVTAGLLGGEVIFTDYDPHSLQFTKMNWDLNSTRSARFELMDWNDPNPGFAADLVLGADCAYGPDFEDLLLNTFDVICKPGGTILLTDPFRQFSNPFYEKLENNPKYDTRSQKVLEEYHDKSGKQALRVTRLRKRQL